MYESKIVQIAVIAVLVWVLAVGCGGPDGVEVARGGIISFAPNITETLYELGQGGRVTGVTSFCDYPASVKKLACVGGHFDPDLEKVTFLAPELIILQGKHTIVDDLARRNGTPVLHVNMDSLASIHEGITTLGEALECQDRAAQLNERIQGELEAVRALVSGRVRPRVLIVTMRQSHDLNSLYSVGATSFVGELIEVAGGANIYADSENPYIEASKETVVVRKPEVIIEFHAGEKLDAGQRAAYIDDWKQLPSLPAVANNRIHLVTESHALRPGPRVGEIARILAKLLHPDAGL